MARSTVDRDRLAAAQGLIKTMDIAKLIGVRRITILNWPCDYTDILGTRYYKWQSVLEHLGLDAVEALQLPLHAKDAFERAVEMRANKVFVVPIKANACGEVHPTDSNLVCARTKGHNDVHRAHLGSDWGPEWGMKQDTARKRKAKALKKTEVARDYHAIEADVPDPTHPYLPHAHPRTKYFAHPMKMSPEKLESFPVYSWRVPRQDTMNGAKWRADRNVDKKDSIPDWWIGEFITDEGLSVVKWSKALTVVDRKENIPPIQAADGATLAPDPTIVYDDGSGVAPKPVIAPPPPLPIPVPPPPPPPQVSSTAPSLPTPTLTINVPSPPPVVKLVCQLCGHSVDYHGSSGCKFAAGTVAACACTQPAPKMAHP